MCVCDHVLPCVVCLLQLAVIPSASLVYGSVLGAGNYGAVRLAEYLGSEVAVKETKVCVFERWCCVYVGMCVCVCVRFCYVRLCLWRLAVGH